MWIFGYGSLLWKTDFPYEKSIAGYVKGYVRRFWQKSPDHRGTEEKPGRTVTLVPDEKGEVYGIAYLVPKEHVIGVREYLDYREKAGYGLQSVYFYPESELKPFHLDVYISPPHGTNEYYAGPETNDQIAKTIVSCTGPSGTNIEYLLKLAFNVRTLNPNIIDNHLFDLEKLVLKICGEMKIEDPCLKELGYLTRNDC